MRSRAPWHATVRAPTCCCPRHLHHHLRPHLHRHHLHHHLRHQQPCLHHPRLPAARLPRRHLRRPLSGHRLPLVGGAAAAVAHRLRRLHRPDRLSPPPPQGAARALSPPPRLPASPPPRLPAPHPLHSTPPPRLPPTPPPTRWRTTSCTRSPQTRSRPSRRTSSSRSNGSSRTSTAPSTGAARTPPPRTPPHIPPRPVACGPKRAVCACCPPLPPPPPNPPPLFQVQEHPVGGGARLPDGRRPLGRRLDRPRPGGAPLLRVQPVGLSRHVTPDLTPRIPHIPTGPPLLRVQPVGLGVDPPRRAPRRVPRGAPLRRRAADRPRGAGVGLAPRRRRAADRLEGAREGDAVPTPRRQLGHVAAARGGDHPRVARRAGDAEAADAAVARRRRRRRARRADRGGRPPSPKPPSTRWAKGSSMLCPRRSATASSARRVRRRAARPRRPALLGSPPRSSLPTRRSDPAPPTPHLRPRISRPTPVRIRDARDRLRRGEAGLARAGLPRGTARPPRRADRPGDGRRPARPRRVRLRRGGGRCGRPGTHRRRERGAPHAPRAARPQRAGPAARTRMTLSELLYSMPV